MNNMYHILSQSYGSDSLPLRYVAYVCLSANQCLSISQSGIWMFRYSVRSHLVRSRPPIGPFATRYFSHLIDHSRFATTMFFTASRPIMTVNYSLTTEPHSFPPFMTVNYSLTTKLHRLLLSSLSTSRTFKFKNDVFFLNKDHVRNRIQFAYILKACSLKNYESYNDCKHVFLRKPDGLCTQQNKRCLNTLHIFAMASVF